MCKFTYFLKDMYLDNVSEHSFPHILFSLLSAIWDDVLGNIVELLIVSFRIQGYTRLANAHGSRVQTILLFNQLVGWNETKKVFILFPAALLQIEFSILSWSLNSISQF